MPPYVRSLLHEESVPTKTLTMVQQLLLQNFQKDYA